jgi:hypothetical protein
LQGPRVQICAHARVAPALPRMTRPRPSVPARGRATRWGGVRAIRESDIARSEREDDDQAVTIDVEATKATTNPSAVDGEANGEREPWEIARDLYEMSRQAAEEMEAASRNNPGPYEPHLHRKRPTPAAFAASHTRAVIRVGKPYQRPRASLPARHAAGTRTVDRRNADAYDDAWCGRTGADPAKVAAAARAHEAAANVYGAVQDIRGEQGPSAAADRWHRDSAANATRKTEGSDGAPKPGKRRSRRPQGAARVYNMEQEELDKHKTAMVKLLNAGENFDQVLEDVAEDGLLNQTLLDLLVDRMEVRMCVWACACACVCMCSHPPRARCRL